MRLSRRRPTILEAHRQSRRREAAGVARCTLTRGRPGEVETGEKDAQDPVPTCCGQCSGLSRFTGRLSPQRLGRAAGRISGRARRSPIPVGELTGSADLDVPLRRESGSRPRCRRPAPGVHPGPRRIPGEVLAVDARPRARPRSPGSSGSGCPLRNCTSLPPRWRRPRQVDTRPPRGAPPSATSGSTRSCVAQLGLRIRGASPFNTCVSKPTQSAGGAVQRQLCSSRSGPLTVDKSTSAVSATARHGAVVRLVNVAGHRPLQRARRRRVGGRRPRSAAQEGEQRLRPVGAFWHRGPSLEAAAACLAPAGYRRSLADPRIARCRAAGYIAQLPAEPGAVVFAEEDSACAP